jgi:glycosyltransferase-like protein
MTATSTPRPSVGLFTYSTLPRGSVVHTAHLADALVAEGWRVTVYALDKDGGGFFRPLRAELRLVAAAPSPTSTAELVRLRTRELADYLLRHAPVHDIHHAEDCLTASALRSARAQGAAVSLTRTVHHVEAFASPYLAHCQEQSIRQADLCFTVSQSARREVAAAFGVDSFVVGNGVDAARFHPAPDPAAGRALGATWATSNVRPVILAVGGVEPRKNTLRILAAFARLHATMPAARLWILGGASVLDHGDYRAAYERARAELPSATRAAVLELGVLPEDEVPAVFRRADVLALPSLHEGFGLAALEALASGLPAVVSNQAPFTEFLDDSCAILVDPLSSDAIVAGVRQALRASVAFRQAGRRRAEEHSWRRVAALHIKHYERTMTHARNALCRALA